ncbi:MAG: hypothetical protein U0573_15760 [Phycisphaerales bacterium]|nr:hypothetical protein [Planctomycetota bacterium]
MTPIPSPTPSPIPTPAPATSSTPARTLPRLARRGIALALGLCALLQTACNMVKPVSISGSELLEHSPSLALDVENSHGSILVRVNPKLTQPRIGAVAYAGVAQGSANYQSDLWATASLAETDGRAVLTVRTKPQEGPDVGKWVQLAIELPSCDGIRAKNSGGLIDIRDVSGAIWIENGGAGFEGGPIYLEAAKPITAPVTISTSSGNIQVVLPTGSTGDIELISSGTKLTDLRAWTGQVDNTTIKPGYFHGILNRGTNPIKLRCTDGDVELRIGPYRFGNPQNKYYKNWYFT